MHFVKARRRSARALPAMRRARNPSESCALNTRVSRRPPHKKSGFKPSMHTQWLHNLQRHCSNSSTDTSSSHFGVKVMQVMQFINQKIGTYRCSARQFGAPALFVAAMLTSAAWAHTASADDASAPQGRKGPRPEALAACQSLSSGQVCSFEAPRGVVKGTCAAPEGKPLACRPSDMPPREQRQPKSGD